MPDLKPIPADFYSSSAWHQNLLEYYGDKPKFLPKNILNAPIAILTKGVATSIEVYGAYTQDQINFLSYTVNPLYEKGEFKKTTYKHIADAATNTPFPKFNEMADALLNIRMMFERDKEFLLTHFKTEINQLEGASEETKFLLFAEALRSIVKTHINQVVELIKTECSI